MFLYFYTVELYLGYPKRQFVIESAAIVALGAGEDAVAVIISDWHTSAVQHIWDTGAERQPLNSLVHTSLVGTTHQKPVIQ